jgi:two-component system, NtrC family, sensor histidine kinase GlrK
MNFLRPKSILRLVLTGFLLVVLPLIAALVFATISVDRLVTHSQQALLQSVFVTQGSQVLVETVKAMERNARQYQVLGDLVLFDVYKENHERFNDAVRGLESQDLSTEQRGLLDALHISENDLHKLLLAHPHDAPETVAAMPTFIELGRIAQQILVNSQDLITRGVEQMQDESEGVQRTLVIQAVALVPAAVILTVIFAVLISRPVRQIDQAIRRLGDGSFSDTPVITGPRDLQQLGARLDWLRLRLLELEQDKTRFLQHMSHELKTPLTAIREGTELLREQVVGTLNEQQSEIAGILHESGLQLQKLIEDLLNFSIVQSRDSSLVRKPVEFDQLVEEVLAGHKITMLSRQLETDVKLQPVVLNGDREKLRILVDNLVSNAVKYSPDGGRLSVRLDLRDKMAVLEVADAGPGIPERERERVFEAFYQGTPANRGPVRGTGLGLSIAREYAKAHGGAISVIRSVHDGACLQVRLPVEQGV